MLLLSGHADGRIRCWDVTTRALRPLLLSTSGLDETDARLRVVAVHFDEQAGAAVWADEGGRIFVGSISASPRMSGTVPRALTIPALRCSFVSFPAVCRTARLCGARAGAIPWAHCNEAGEISYWENAAAAADISFVHSPSGSAMDIRSPTKSDGKSVDYETAAFSVDEADEDEDGDDGFNQDIESLVGQLRCTAARACRRAHRSVSRPHWRHQ